jgi:hypothetical protein
MTRRRPGRSARGLALALLSAGCGEGATAPEFEFAFDGQVRTVGAGPNWLVDGLLVDTDWPMAAPLDLVLATPARLPSNPVIPDRAGYVHVLPTSGGAFQMWYTSSYYQGGEVNWFEGIGFAQSTDALTWTRPNLGLFPWPGPAPNNIVLGDTLGRTRGGFVIDGAMASSLPGGSLWMLVRRRNELHLVPSSDGVHWNESGSRILIRPYAADTHPSIYGAVGDLSLVTRPIGDREARRRIARRTSPALIGPWSSSSENVIEPDAADSIAGIPEFYGMSVRPHGGMLWGFIWRLKNGERVDAELVWSRDGVRFSRHPDRVPFLTPGPAGAWDDGMVFPSASWVERDGRWIFYYAGWDDEHSVLPRKAGIGVFTTPRNRLVGVRPRTGEGQLATHPFTWPGGDLLVDGAAAGGSLEVIATDPEGRRIATADPATGDLVGARIVWRGNAPPVGQPVRLVFRLQGAVLFAFTLPAGRP